MEEIIYSCTGCEKFGIGEDFEMKVWAVNFELRIYTLDLNLLGEIWH